MNKAETEKRVIAVCRTRHFSYKTEVAYLAQIRRYLAFITAADRGATSEARVRAYLESIAPHVAAKTQCQALNAIVFLYRDVLEKPLGELGNWSHAKRPQRLPVWLSPSETARVLALTPDNSYGLMLRLTYGCGLRLMECCRLRAQHIDLEKRLLRLVGAKGDKDRTVPLPQSLLAPLGEHLARVRALWEGDLARGTPPVELPGTLAAKYPNAGREWAWFWVFPSKSLSTDPRSRIVRRHHVHEDGLAKVLKTAVHRAGIAKRVTMHVLRHSYATHLLEQGVVVTKLQQLLGHKHLESTAVYVHTLPRDLAGIPSPLDALPGQVVPFTRAA